MTHKNNLQLRPFFVSYVNGHYEEICDELVFAYDEPGAIKLILETLSDARFVFETKEASQRLTNVAA